MIEIIEENIENFLFKMEIDEYHFEDFEIEERYCLNCCTRQNHEKTKNGFYFCCKCKVITNDRIPDNFIPMKPLNIIKVRIN